MSDSDMETVTVELTRWNLERLDDWLGGEASEEDLRRALESIRAGAPQPKRQKKPRREPLCDAAGPAGDLNCERTPNHSGSHRGHHQGTTIAWGGEPGTDAVLEQVADCPVCEGSGEAPDDGGPCDYCAGRGELTAIQELLSALADFDLGREGFIPEGTETDEELIVENPRWMWERLVSAASRCSVA